MLDNLHQKTGIKEMTVLFALSFILVWFSKDFFFFWDNIVQLAVPANYYFDTKFATLYLPDEITTGHQPFVGMYFALGWMIFGRSIEVSHWLMLPFVFGFLWQLFRLVQFFLQKQAHQWIAFLIIVMESALLSQLTLLTFEVFHLFFFVAVLNNFIRRNKLLTVLFFSCLMLVSLRATMSAIGIVIFVLLQQIIIDKKFRVATYLVFIPGFILFATFLLSFYETKGWIIHNTVSKNWENSAKYADFAGMIRNTAIFFWRMFDFGKIIFLFALVYIAFQSIRNKVLDSRFLILLLMAAGQFIIFYVTTIPYENSIAHRYVLPVTIPLLIAIIYWFLTAEKKHRFFVPYIIAYLVLGYFWTYPPEMAKGSDAMPAHWTYYSTWQEMRNYVYDQNISPSDIKTFFPNTATFKNIALLNDESKYGGSGSEHYVLYSNVYNESDETINKLFNRQYFTPVHTIEKGWVRMILFKKAR